MSVDNPLALSQRRGKGRESSDNPPGPCKRKGRAASVLLVENLLHALCIVVDSNYLGKLCAVNELSYKGLIGRIIYIINKDVKQDSF